MVGKQEAFGGVRSPWLGINGADLAMCVRAWRSLLGRSPAELGRWCFIVGLPAHVGYSVHQAVWRLLNCSWKQCEGGLAANSALMAGQTARKGSGISMSWTFQGCIDGHAGDFGSCVDIRSHHSIQRGALDWAWPQFPRALRMGL